MIKPAVRYALLFVALLVLYWLFPLGAVLIFAAWAFFSAGGRFRAFSLLAIPLYLFHACSTTVATVRYRLSFEVEADGVAKSASSIIQLDYVNGSTTTGNATIYPNPTGVAPVIDLGEKGTLLIAIDGEGHGTKWLQHSNSQTTCGRDAYVTALFLDTAFHKAGGEESGFKDEMFLSTKLWWLSGRKKLPHNVPAFIWFPKNADYDEGNYLCADDFSRVINGNLVLRSVAVEIAPRAPVISKFESPGLWLPQLRTYQNPKTRSEIYSNPKQSGDRQDVFIPRMSQLEQWHWGLLSGP